MGLQKASRGKERKETAGDAWDCWVEAVGRGRGVSWVCCAGQGPLDALGTGWRWDMPIVFRGDGQAHSREKKAGAMRVSEEKEQERRLARGSWAAEKGTMTW